MFGLAMGRIRRRDLRRGSQEDGRQVSAIICVVLVQTYFLTPLSSARGQGHQSGDPGSFFISLLCRRGVGFRAFVLSFVLRTSYFIHRTSYFVFCCVSSIDISVCCFAVRCLLFAFFFIH